ncbi:DUF21 domain-containing protein At1g55930, chloroplastic-like [Dioscorea cayenensis subsp. rotundata]|uniref:DUF21 domain-containing protein At1g55930, chloroplastic-like n=1 Tax=Dioscorea cayennensis subsp. rotundata TaxID=55577 RepID=A0AB40CJ45_DIOCR|nr:DUF21 domain-containing protein At1g55930, chloroplastic-like [Dioscorea cayenensis subsp. rotundata]
MHLSIPISSSRPPMRTLIPTVLSLQPPAGLCSVPRFTSCTSASIFREFHQRRRIIYCFPSVPQPLPYLTNKCAAHPCANGALRVRASSEFTGDRESAVERMIGVLNVSVRIGLGFVLVGIACVLLVARCQRVLAAESVADVGLRVFGSGSTTFSGAWPKVVQLLHVFRDQGLILAALLGLSAFFSMAETSITTLWPWKVRELAEKEPENGVFRMLRSDVTRFLTTILIGTTVVNIGATALVTEAATAIFGEAGVSAATGVMTVAILLLTEITPKSVAVHNATDVARFVVRPVAWLSLVLYPVGRVVTFLSMGMLKVLGLKGRSEPYVTEDELKLMLRGAEMSGAIEEEEQDMIENVLEIKDTHVREVMTPLVDVVAIDGSAKLIDFQKLWETHQYSRVPVFEERIDNIVGIAYAMDMLEYVEKVEKLKESTVRDIAHMPTYFVPDSMSVWNLLREFRIRKVHMAVVLNEYGGTVGIVTLEDVVEEIVGEIFDENDSKEEIQKKTGYIVLQEDGTFDVDANTSIDQLSEELNVKIPEGHQYETVSGFICQSFGYIPEEGAKLVVVLEKDDQEDNGEYSRTESDHLDDKETHQTFEIEVLEANERKVGKVRFKPIENEPVELEAKGISRLFSTKVVKRKKKLDKDDENNERNGDEITSPEDLDSIYLREVQIQKRFDDTNYYSPDDDKEDDHVGNYKH